MNEKREMMLQQSMQAVTEPAISRQAIQVVFRQYNRATKYGVEKGTHRQYTWRDTYFTCDPLTQIHFQVNYLQWL